MDIRPAAIDWVAVGLGAFGGILAFVASVMGVRTKKPLEVFQSGSTGLWRAIRSTSWVLLLGSLAVLAGVGIQIVQLVRRY